MPSTCLYETSHGRAPTRHHHYPPLGPITCGRLLVPRAEHWLWSFVSDSSPPRSGPPSYLKKLPWHANDFPLC